MDTLNKETARERYRALRRALTPEARQAQADAMQAHLLPWLDAKAPRRTLTCVLSYGAEPPTGRLMDALHAQGYRILVPICEPGRRLSWTDWHPGIATSRSAVAPIAEPMGDRHGSDVMAGVDVVLVPAQAIDTTGARLGQGGGYYDRFIASLDEFTPRPLLLSMVYEHEFLPADSFVYNALDRRVDAVLTPSGITWFGDDAAR